MVRVPCLQSCGRFGGWPAAARPSKKGRSEVVPECFRVEVGWDSLLRLPAAAESRSPRGPQALRPLGAALRVLAPRGADRAGPPGSPSTTFDSVRYRLRAPSA